MKTVLALLLVATVIAITLHPRKSHRHRVEYLGIPAGAFTNAGKATVNGLGTAVEFGAKATDDNLTSFANSLDDLLKGGKTVDSITSADIKEIGKNLDIFKDASTVDAFVGALKNAYKNDTYKVFDDFVVDTRRLDDLVDIPPATQAKVFEDAEKRLNVRFENAPGDEQLFKTWQHIALMRKGPNTLLSSLKNADIARAIDDYVAARNVPLEEGTQLQQLRKSLDDPSAWSRFVNSSIISKVVTGGFFAGMLASILVGIFVKPSYFKDGDSAGDSGYDPYTGECAAGDLECTAAQWMDWLNENSTLVGLGSCFSCCLCLCCCCMLSLALIMDGENQNSFF